MNDQQRGSEPASGAGQAPLEVLPPLLEAAAETVNGLGPDHAATGRQFDGLRGRLLEGRFHLAVLGQFKRGKSTLLNALLGADVLATSVVPLTAIPTFLAWGPARRARIAFTDGKPPIDQGFPTDQALQEFLEAYVTETGNPKNHLEVAQVEVFLPAAILQKGVVLIDTPGIGSTFRHNTEATLNFLCQCDAALFIVSADPPITEVEIGFLGQVRSKVPHLCFVMNKIDYLDETERATAIEFLSRVLAAQGSPPAAAELFPISARRGLQSRLAADDARWRESGMERLESYLLKFLATEKSRTLAVAVTRKALALLDELQMSLALRLQSMAIPIDDLERRLATFETRLRDTETERLSSQDLLKGANKRMHEALEAYSEELRTRAFSYLEGVARQEMEQANGADADEDYFRNVVGRAIPGYFEHETGKAVKHFADRMAQALAPFQQRTDRLIGDIRRTAAELFDIPYQAPEGADAFKMVEQPYWVTHKWRASFRPFSASFLDRFSSAAARKARIFARLVEQLKDLAIENVENLRWPIFQSIDQTFMRFGSDLDHRLQETIAATHGAMKATLDFRRHRASELAPLRELLTATANRLTELRGQFAASLTATPASPDQPAGQPTGHPASP